MVMPLHRYKFESNSQPDYTEMCKKTRWLCHYIDTSLKAIHNTCNKWDSIIPMVMPLHRYKFESNSQQPCSVCRAWYGWLCHYIDTSLKAIHNINPCRVWACRMVMPLHRYNDFKDQEHHFIWCRCKDNHFLWISKILIELFTRLKNLKGVQKYLKRK